MTTPSPPKRRHNPNTPATESKVLIYLNDDKTEFKSVMEAACSPSFLSPKGKELVKQAMKSSLPLDLESINRSVVAQDLEDDWITQDNNKKPFSAPTKNLRKEGKKEKVGNTGGERALRSHNENKRWCEQEMQGSERNKSEKKFQKRSKKSNSDSDDSVEIVNALKSTFLKPPPKDICLSCGMNPCEKDLYKEVITKAGMDASLKMKDHNKAIRHHLYKYYIAAKYGPLGKTNRVCIPFCVESYIRVLYPDPNAKYTGFRSSYGNNNPCKHSSSKSTDILDSDEEDDYDVEF